jgi:hypothetical protein
MTTRRRIASSLTLSGLLLSPLVHAAQSQQPADPKLTEVWEPVPRVVTPGIGAAAPSDAIVLFNGRNLSEWQRDDGSPAKWKIGEHAMTVVKSGGNIQTKRAFGDCQLHIEWRTPSKVEGEGQERGNSGVFLQGRYEVQVLDSYNNRTYSNGQAGSIYKQYIPMVNASRKPGEWQSYDIFFRAPRFSDNGTVTTPGYMTVVHNGVLVQDHVEIKGTTFNSGPQSYQKHNLKEPLMLQDHGTPVSYRNIWIREL